MLIKVEMERKVHVQFLFLFLSLFFQFWSSGVSSKSMIHNGQRLLWRSDLVVHRLGHCNTPTVQSLHCAVTIITSPIISVSWCIPQSSSLSVSLLNLTSETEDSLLGHLALHSGAWTYNVKGNQWGFFVFRKQCTLRITWLIVEGGVGRMLVFINFSLSPRVYSDLPLTDWWQLFGYHFWLP